MRLRTGCAPAVAEPRRVALGRMDLPEMRHAHGPMGKSEIVGARAAMLIVGNLICASGAMAETVVATADRMVDVLAGRIVARPQITITDGRITGVSDQDAPAAPGARHID